MQRLRVAFDAVPLARWGPLFHVLLLELPDLSVDWQPRGFPTADQPLLDGADVGLFLQPPAEPGLDSLVIETSEMAVGMAVGHRLGRTSELSIAEILDEPFPGTPKAHPEWRAFWTLDEHRGGPPKVTDDDVQTAQEGLEVVRLGAGDRHHAGVPGQRTSPSRPRRCPADGRAASRHVPGLALGGREAGGSRADRPGTCHDSAPRTDRPITVMEQP